MALHKDYQLRPFTSDESALFAHRLDDPEVWRPYNWFGFENAGSPGTGGRNPALTDGGRLAVTHEGNTVAGQVQWVPGFWYGGLDRHRAWNVGLIILPEFRRTRAASTAMNLLIEYLFTHTTVHRIEATTSSDALARNAGIPGAGMLREGTLRRAQWREGQWRDVALLAVLREEWELKKSFSETPDVKKSGRNFAD